jgi:hypothetical protein
MERRTAYWLTTATIILLTICGFVLKIIFWPEYRFTGRVVDIKTKHPIANAVVYIPNSENYSLTDYDGKFELTSGRPGKTLIDIKARGFESKLCEDKNNRILTTTDIGTIFLETDIMVGWPIPDSIKTKINNISPTLTYSWDNEIKRSVRLSFKFKEPPEDADYFPRSHSLRDSTGGEWYLFFIWDSPYMITYINPDGSFERYIPTPLMQRGYRSMELRGKLLYVSGVLGKKPENQESYLDSFTVADLHADVDNDSLLDRFELFCRTDPNNSDSDNDGLSDFEDPMPTIARNTQYNDTTALLEVVLGDVEFNPLIFESNSINRVTESLRDNDRTRFINIAQNYVPFFEENTSYYGSFEGLLLKMNIAELKIIASILRNNFSDFELSNRFHYYSYLTQVSENNIDLVKAEIFADISTIPIIPVNVQGDVVDFRTHPKNSWQIILPVNPYEFHRKILERLYIREYIDLMKMNSSEAVVHLSTPLFGYELIYIKHQGKWKQVDHFQIYIS